MDIPSFQEKILIWYQENKRDLPWRKTTDAYKILVSETMLQQTQVDRVIPKYEAFLKQFPTIQQLATASRGDVLALWSGLGFNSRAVRLHELAKTVTEKYNGKLPKDHELLLSLPGVGPYTANAILSFAFNMPCACVDTNIRRILIHELQLEETISDKQLQDVAQSVIPNNKSCDWHNALMDYGSTVLTSKKTGIKPKSTQSIFKGSRRWYRGQIMKQLVQEKEVLISDLCEQFEKDEEWIIGLVKEMATEGLLTVTKKKITL